MSAAIGKAAKLVCAPGATTFERPYNSEPTREKWCSFGCCMAYNSKACHMLHMYVNIHSTISQAGNCNTSDIILSSSCIVSSALVPDFFVVFSYLHLLIIANLSAKPTKT